jgi:hypothetical protein
MQTVFRGPQPQAFFPLAAVHGAGALAGIITQATGNASFAVPIESVIGLANSGNRTSAGIGVEIIGAQR